MDHGVDHHDRSTTALFHLRDDFLTEVQRTEQVHLHRLAPVVEITVFEQREPTRAVGAVDQYIHSTEFRDRRVDQRFALSAVGDVGRHRQRFATRLAKFGFDLVEKALRPRSKHDACPLRGQLYG